VKVFLDSNILVSSFAFKGVTRDLVAHLVEKHRIFVSEDVLREVKRTLLGKLYSTPSTVETFIDELHDIAVMIDPPFQTSIKVRDPDDIPILAAAIKSSADVLVTGDKDLLELTNPPIRILRPRELYDELRKKV
jgi:putative PIN family toxin of toxin-antitoxin system